MKPFRFGSNELYVRRPLQDYPLSIRAKGLSRSGFSPEWQKEKKGLTPNLHSKVLSAKIVFSTRPMRVTKTIS